MGSRGGHSGQLLRHLLSAPDPGAHPEGADGGGEGCQAEGGQPACLFLVTGLLVLKDTRLKLRTAVSCQLSSVAPRYAGADLKCLLGH